MKIVFGADGRTNLTETLIEALKLRGHGVEVVGPLAGEPAGWADVAREVGERVVLSRADRGVVCCWTGTGASIAANKVSGIRAALCGDATTAQGARRWNDANVLALSLRSTSAAELGEILDAWFAGEPSADADDRANVGHLSEIETGDS